MIPTPEKPAGTEHPLELSGKQRTLYNSLLRKDDQLAKMYLGALSVFSQKSNPDYQALAAHGLRELLEKLPLSVGITPQIPDTVSKVTKLENFWNKLALKSDCFSGGLFYGEIDDKLKSFLEKANDFFGEFQARPNRKDEQKETLRALDGSTTNIPEPIENLRIDELNTHKGFFTGVSHHSKDTTEGEFSLYLGRLEHFLLDYLVPRTFDDHAKIDALIKLGEKNAR